MTDSTVSRRFRPGTFSDPLTEVPRGAPRAWRSFPPPASKGRLQRRLRRRAGGAAIEAAQSPTGNSCLARHSAGEEHDPGGMEEGLG